jgi:hypothetical protein
MLQARREPDLAREPFRAESFRQLGGEHLDHDVASQHLVVHHEDA